MSSNLSAKTAIESLTEVAHINSKKCIMSLILIDQEKETLKYIHCHLRIVIALIDWKVINQVYAPPFSSSMHVALPR